MKPCILLIAFTISVFAGLTQPDSTQQDSAQILRQSTGNIRIPFISYWAAGDTYQFRITKIKRQWNGGEISKNDSASYDMTFSVLDSTDSSYRIKWSRNWNIGSSPGDLPIPKELFSQLEQFQQNEVIYQTNEVGEFLEIENWEEISEQMVNMFESIEGLLRKGNVSADKQTEIQQALQPFIDIYRTQQGIEQLAFKEIQYFHFPFGVEFVVGEVIEYIDQVPNMFGGDPLRGNSSLIVDSVDQENFFCVLNQRMQLNPEDTKNMLAEMFARMNLKDEKIQEGLASATYDIRDNNRFEFYYDPGVPSLIETRRDVLVKVGPVQSKGLEITRIELVE